MIVIFIHGPAASGKYTIGKKLSEATGLPLFHNHLTVDLVKTLFDFGSDGFIHLREKIWLLAFEEAAGAGKSFIFTFNPEKTVAPDLIERLQKIYEDQGGEFIYIELKCPDELILERIDSDGRKQFGKLTDPDSYKSIKAQGGFHYPKLPNPRITIHTDRTSPEEAVGEIISSIKQALL